MNRFSVSSRLICLPRNSTFKMMKTHLLALRNVIRNVQQFSALSVKILAQPSSRSNGSAYQRLDGPHGCHTTATAKVTMSKMLRKCWHQFSTSTTTRKMSTSGAHASNCWNCTEKQAFDEELHVFCRNCGFIREINDSEKVNLYI